MPLAHRTAYWDEEGLGTGACKWQLEQNNIYGWDSLRPLPKQGSSMAQNWWQTLRHFSNGKNSLVLFHKYNGWSLFMWEYCKPQLLPLPKECIRGVGTMIQSTRQCFLAENSVHVIDWPSNSPRTSTQLKIHGKLWRIMLKIECHKIYVEERDAIPQEIVNNLVSSVVSISHGRAYGYRHGLRFS